MKFFTFFMPKNNLFSIFGPPLFSGRRPEKKIGISLKLLHRKIFQVGSPQTVHLKIPSFLKSDATLTKKLLPHAVGGPKGALEGPKKGPF